MVDRLDVPEGAQPPPSAVTPSPEREGREIAAEKVVTRKPERPEPKPEPEPTQPKLDVVERTKELERLAETGASTGELYKYMNVYRFRGFTGANAGRIRRKIAEDIDTINVAKGKERFDLMVSKGFIPKGARFIKEAQEQVKYLTPDQVTEIQARRGRMIALKPFIEEREGTGVLSIDVAAALSSGISERTLLGVGVSPVTISQSKSATRASQAHNLISMRQQGIFKDKYTKLPDGSYMEKAVLDDLKTDNPVAHRLITEQGYGAYEKAVTDLVDLLKPYEREGGYRLSFATGAGIPDKVLSLLFTQEDIDKAHIRYLPEARREELAKPKLPKSLASLLPVLGAVAVVEPTPIVDILVVLLAAGGIAWAMDQAGMKIDLPSVVSGAIDQFKQEQEREPTIDDVMVVSKTGELSTARELLPTTIVTGLKSGVPPLIPPKVAIKLEGIKPPIGKIKPEGIKPVPVERKLMITQELSEADKAALRLGPNYQEPVIFLGPNRTHPIPRRLIEESQKTLLERSGVMMSVANVTKIANNAAKQAGTRTIEIDWNKLMHQRDIDTAVTTVNEAMASARASGRLKADISRAYAEAYNDYLAKKARYQSTQQAIVKARSDYIDFMNKSIYAINGTVTGDMIKSFTALQMSQILRKSLDKAMTRSVTSVGDAQQLANLAAYTSLMQSIADADTTTEMTTEMTTAMEQAIEMAINLAVNTNVATDIQTLSKMITNVATNTAVSTAAITTTIPITAITTPIIGKIPEIKKGKAGDGGERKKIKAGSYAWKQGLYWKFIPPPYNQPKPITLPRGVVPVGAIKTGGRTPAETIQMIGKSGAIIPARVDVDMGVVDAFITPDSGGRIVFKGRGLETNVGGRIGGTTKGMDLGEGDDLFGDYNEYRPRKRKPKKKIKKVSKLPTSVGKMRG